MIAAISTIVYSLSALAFLLIAIANIFSGTLSSPITFSVAASLYVLFAIEGYLTYIPSVSKYCFLPALIVLPKQVVGLIGNHVDSWKKLLIEVALYLALGSAQIATIEYELHSICQTISLCLFVSVAVSVRNHALSRYLQAIFSIFSIIIAIAPSWPQVLAVIPVATCISGLPVISRKQKQTDCQQLNPNYLATKRVSFSGILPMDSAPVNVAKNTSAAEALFAEKRALSSQKSLSSHLENSSTFRAESNQTPATATCSKLSFDSQGETIRTVPSEPASATEHDQKFSRGNEVSASINTAAAVPEGELLAPDPIVKICFADDDDALNTISSHRKRSPKTHQPIALSVNFDIKH